MSFESRRKLLVRIMAIFLVALMLLGSFAVVIQSLGMGSYAADSQSSAMPESEPSQPIETIRTATETVRIGLMYGSGVTVGFEVRAENGMNFGCVIDDQFTPLWQTSLTLVSATSDANLSKSAMTYSVTTSTEAVIGGWHLECDAGSDAATAQSLLVTVDSLAMPYGLDTFPAFINGAFTIRLGDFTSKLEAESALAKLNAVLGSYVTLRVASPSTTGVSVVDPNTDDILFEYDSPGSSLGITPIQVGETVTRLVTPAKNLYAGIFEFSRYINGSTDGVALTNILTLDDYVMGVLPYEISNTWPMEVQKSFAVTVRTYTLSMLGRHNSSYGFDLCNSTHCQAYLGCRRIDDTVIEAVTSTHGMVLTYGGDLAHTYYSAVIGGASVDIRDAWGGKVEYPYLTAVATPWEDYSAHKYGEWVTEMSPTQLCKRLAEKGYNVSGSITKVKIEALASNSSYVKSISFTDSNGKTVTVNTTDKVRTVLGLNSSNFVVGRAGEAVTRLNFNLATPTPILPPSDNSSGDAAEVDKPEISNDLLLSGAGVKVLTADGLVSYTPGESVTYTKNIGSETTVNLSSLTVLTGDGTFGYDMTSEYDANYSDLYSGAVSAGMTVVGAAEADLSDIRAYSTTVTEETIVLPGSAGNFVFYGRGWGHGVGMSQYGALNLAQLGYDAVTILKAYFPGTSITILP